MQLAPGVFIPAGDYRGASFLFDLTLDPSRALAGRFLFSPQVGFFGGSKKTFGVAPQWKPTPSLILDLDYNIDRIRLSQARFTSHIANLTVHYAPSTRIITSTTLQYNSQARVGAFNFRLNFIYRPGDDLFVVYRHVRNRLNPDFGERALLVKLTRSFDF